MRFSFDFHTPDHWRLTVTGRNLWAAFNYIAHYRLDWIRLGEGNGEKFAPESQLVISGVEIERVQDDGKPFTG